MGKKAKKPTEKRQWVTTAIPRALAKEIAPHIQEGKYTGITAFIADAVRRRLEELSKPVEVPAQ